jgi:hypothetical protein
MWPNNRIRDLFDIQCPMMPRSFRSLPQLWDRFGQSLRRQDRATSLPCGPAKRRALLESFLQQS